MRRRDTVRKARTYGFAGIQWQCRARQWRCRLCQSFSIWAVSVSICVSCASPRPPRDASRSAAPGIGKSMYCLRPRHEVGERRNDAACARASRAPRPRRRRARCRDAFASRDNCTGSQELPEAAFKALAGSSVQCMRGLAVTPARGACGRSAQASAPMKRPLSAAASSLVERGGRCTTSHYPRILSSQRSSHQETKGKGRERLESLSEPPKRGSSEMPRPTKSRSRLYTNSAVQYGEARG
eukprot:1591588-Prymnesium_polylepis.3